MENIPLININIDIHYDSDILVGHSLCPQLHYHVSFINFYGHTCVDLNSAYCNGFTHCIENKTANYNCPKV